MSFLKKIFGSKEEPVKSNQDFWNWFQQNAESFFKVVKDGHNIEKDFFDKLSPKLKELKDGFYFLAGMVNNETAELVLTADGIISNIAFVEDLVADAPKIKGWLFTALKPALNIADVNIKMGDLNFNKDNLSFYYTEKANFPDEIDVSVIHSDFNEENKDHITNGTYIFLDNFLGELNFATTIDKISVIGKDQATQELIPIEKLKDFLIWREKEFIERYDGIRHDTENDQYNMLEATLKNGNPLLAVVNTDLLNWDSKASHPWILNIEVKFSANENGMPNKTDYQLLNDFEDEILSLLKDSDGYLNIGRETANGIREIFFACKDFRKPSKVMHEIEIRYADKFDISHEIYRDKYWKSFDRFKGN
ncbi:DUF695 domain-containing protein [Pedobacter frigidisoli]|uniref:DUF695 domain-containing protein n=1 Tax=Pedobacter frigidisoli TaxID=2530455 RepID=A0A4R0P8U0_9SPHI|nr:DUF695 domain-containing protein [Pedobacter frigidisoli]TCD11097.1 DUF695 domain-containing protein [Pedobacter frigidisoli]